MPSIIRPSAGTTCRTPRSLGNSARSTNWSLPLRLPYAATDSKSVTSGDGRGAARVAQPNAKGIRIIVAVRSKGRAGIGTR
ncbi:MAG: hypothetical protein ACK6D1_10565 [Planctomycetota bacterium]